MYIRLGRQSALHSHAKMLVLTVLLHSITLGALRATLADEQPMLGSILQRSSEVNKQWWKRVEIMLPTFIATALVIGVIARKMNAQSPQPHTPSTPPQHEMTKQSFTGNGKNSVASGADDNRLKEGVPPADTLEENEISHVTDPEIASDVDSGRAGAQRTETTKDTPAEQEKQKAALKACYDNSKKLGLMIGDVAKEANQDAYDTQIRKAIKWFEETILVKIYGKNHVKRRLESNYHKRPEISVDQFLAKTFFADMTSKDFITAVTQLVKDAVGVLPCYIVTEQGLQAVKRLNELQTLRNKNVAVDCLQTVVKIFTTAQKNTPDGFLKLENADAQLFALRSDTFTSSIGHAEALKNLATYMIKHSKEERVKNLDSRVVKAIQGHFTEWGMGVDKDRFKKVFKDKLEAQTLTTPTTTT